MGNSPTVQWLEPSTLTAKSLGSILGWGTITLQALLPKEKKEIDNLGPQQDLVAWDFLARHLGWCVELCDVNQL